MIRPQVIDAFMFNNELDILQMRLEELYDAVDRFVLVEAPKDHQDHDKPLWFADNRGRFAPWADKIVHVVAGPMPTMAEDNDPWAREHAQREFIGHGLAAIDGLSDQDVILQSDVDEIPRALYARNCRPGGKAWSFAQRGHFFAVDWLYPYPWFGTVAMTVGALGRLRPSTRFSYMRDIRLTCENPPHLQDAGWHFSWLGGPEAAMRKVGSFCHPEVEDRIVNGLESDRFHRAGIHVDGAQMAPVEVNDEWPAFIRERRCPESWWRSR
jgi:beta-1,4-mannosyl-glycoprotein beta-1,4-N-acetylglucosaminyltransferase